MSEQKTKDLQEFRTLTAKMTTAEKVELRNVMSILRLSQEVARTDGGEGHDG